VNQLFETVAVKLVLMFTCCVLTCILLFPVIAWNRDTVVAAEGNGDLQTLISVLVARSRRCPLTKLNGGLSRLHSADEDEEAVSWLTSYGS